MMDSDLELSSAFFLCSISVVLSSVLLFRSFLLHTLSSCTTTLVSMHTRYLCF